MSKSSSSASSSSASSSASGMRIKVSEFVEEKFARFDEAQQQTAATSNGTGTGTGTGGGNRGVMLTPSYVRQMQKLLNCNSNNSNSTSISSSNGSNDSTANMNHRDEGGGGGEVVEEEEEVVDPNSNSIGEQEQEQKQYLLPQRVIVLLLILHDLSEILYFVFRWMKMMVWDNGCYYLDIVYNLVIPDHWQEWIATHANLQSLDTAYYAYMGSKASAPPPALAALAVCTIFALLVHPDGYTWVVVGEIIEMIRGFFRFLQTTFSCLREGRMPYFISVKYFGGIMVLVLACLYIHHIITSENDSPTTRTRTKKSSKRGKHKGRQRHSHSLQSGSKAKTRHHQSDHLQSTSQNSLTRAIVESPPENCDDNRSLANSIVTCPDAPQVIHNSVSTSSSSNILQSDVCPGRRKSFDSMDNSSDISSSINSTSNNVVDEALHTSLTNSSSTISPEKSTKPYLEQSKSIPENRQTRTMSEDNCLQVKEHHTARSSRKIKWNLQKSVIENNSLKTSNAACQSSSKPHKSSRQKVSDSSKEEAKIQSKKTNTDGDGLNKSDKGGSIPSDSGASKQIRFNLQQQDANYARIHSESSRMGLHANTNKMNSQNRDSSDRMNGIRYSVPYFANAISADARYTPGKLELASFLAQAGLVGTECAQLLSDLADVDALRSFNDFDFEKYRVDFEKKNRILMLLEARRRAEMSRNLGHQQQQQQQYRFQFNEQPATCSNITNSHYQHQRNWNDNTMPIRPPPGLDGFVSHEDKPFDGSPFHSSFSQVIGTPYVKNREEQRNLSPPESLAGSTNKIGVVSPRSMEDGYQFHQRESASDLQRFPQSQSLYFGHSVEGQQQTYDEDMMIEAEMSALGDQMAGSILDF